MDLRDETGIGHENTVDVEQVPDAIPQGNFKSVDLPEEAAIIAFDLETTGLIVGGVMPHITQIAAVQVQSGEQFNTYVTPKIPISSGATAVTGISIMDGQMKINGAVVQSISITSAMEHMIRWLGRFDNVCLVAHNGRRFDFPIILSALQSIGAINNFPVCAFIDSMSVFRELYKNTSLKQVDLVRSLLGTTYDAHNAMADVTSLGQLLKFVNLSQNALMMHSFMPLAVTNQMLFNRAKAANLGTLDPLIDHGVCNRPTAEKIAGSGLKLAHLQMVQRRSGEDGIRDVFTAENSDGLPRVTTKKKLLEEVIPKLVQYFENQ